MTSFFLIFSFSFSVGKTIDRVPVITSLLFLWRGDM